jgi:hypothetical protein
MKTMLMLTLLLMCGSLAAAPDQSVVGRLEIPASKTNNGRPAEIQLLAGPCTAPEVTRYLIFITPPPIVERFKEARLFWGDRWWKACWIELSEHIYLMDEEGALFNNGVGLPKSAFSRGI